MHFWNDLKVISDSAPAFDPVALLTGFPVMFSCLKQIHLPFWHVNLCSQERKMPLRQTTQRAGKLALGLYKYTENGYMP